MLCGIDRASRRLLLELYGTHSERWKMIIMICLFAVKAILQIRQEYIRHVIAIERR